MALTFRPRCLPVASRITASNRCRGTTLSVSCAVRDPVFRRDTVSDVGLGWRLELRCGASPSDSVPVSSASSKNLTPNTFAQLWRFLVALYAFSRPHTVAGTVTSICSISLLALQGIELSFAVLSSVGVALASAVLMNVFIVGLNQMFDIHIDKVNKPHLPLASGELSVFTGWVILAVSLVGSLGLGYLSGSPPLMATLVVSMVLGILYSADIPFMRWKRSALAAAACILAIRAVAVQAGFYFHAQYSLGIRTLQLSKPILYAMALFCYYSVVIALFKDIPDIKGDLKANIHTFTVRLGQKSVFWLCIWLLTAMYTSAIMVGLSSDVWVTRVWFTLGNALSLTFLWKEAREVDLSMKKNITSFYMLVWRLFYLLYFFVPLLRFSA